MFGSKGKLEIKLPGTSFKEGNTINGTIWLNLNEQVKARELRVIFHCYKRVRNTGRDRNGRTKQDDIVTLHKQKISLGGEQEYTTREHAFSMQVPIGLIPEEKQVTRGGILGFLEKQAVESAKRRTSYHWELSASLDIPMGFDLHHEVQLNVYK